MKGTGRFLRSVSLGLALSLTLSFSEFAQAIGGQFGLEFAVDAPWRLEPVPLGNDRFSYPPIPITIAFHDTVFEDGRGTLAAMHFERIAVGKLVGVRVTEIGANQAPVTDIPVSAMEEIEVKRGLSTKLAQPVHDVCRPALGQDCASLLSISDSHEWHGVFWYLPKTAVTPGRNLQLKVTVRTVAKTRVVVSPAGTQPVFIEVDVPKEWTNYVVVHAGEAPLPRFGTHWLYGDVHYHSQMTDNEGESAYSYRNVVRSLGALGFDFVFATDHASNGEQVDGKVNGQREARDLNRPRFEAAKRIIYGPDGANQLIAAEAAKIGFPRLKSAGILPQIYMGEELDAWPEISAKEFADGKLYFGDLGLFGGGLKYDWLWKQEGFLACSTGFAACRAQYARPASPDKQTYLLYDDQGIPVSQEIDTAVGGLGTFINQGSWIPKSVKPLPSRQHIVYFPLDTRLNATGWISSDTGDFGGAGKRLQQIIDEIEIGGFAFLAHPVEDLEPGSLAGPDVVPYSDGALTRAWNSPAILGLQFWNENDRYRAQPTQLDRTVVTEKKTVSNVGLLTSVSYTYRWPFPGELPVGSQWQWQQAGQLHRNIMGTTHHKLHHGAATWDRFLRKGVDLQKTASLRWLKNGEPRKWFMAGGSDAHGDWNYRRYGRPDITNRWNDFPVGDTAIGNPRNLVSMQVQPAQQTAGVAVDPGREHGPRRYSNREVIDALRAGRFSVTDGPAIRIAIDKNRNGKIDDSDFAMGSTIHFLPGEHIPLLVEWFSTAEFGPIDQIDIYVGNSANTFAAKGHGPRLLPFFINQPANIAEELGGYKLDPSGTLQIKLANEAGQFNRTNLPESTRYHGIAKIFLAPAQFQLANIDGALSYVRAFARTITDQQGQDNGVCPQVGTAGTKCGDRFAFSNPIWTKYQLTCPTKRRPGPNRATETFLTSVPAPYLDADTDGMPDVCEREIPNPCASGAAGEANVNVDRPVIRDRPPRLRADHLATILLPKPIPDRSCQVVGPA